MGPVFRGEDSETRRPVVIKVIRVGLTPERVAVVGPALRALKDRLVDHPALCPVLETGVVDVEPFVVSPVVEGDSLDVALREYGPANMADAIPRLRLLADALDAAAAVDVAHGSLHLRDIVVSVEGTILTGIGIAAVLERVGVRPPVRRPYCAPEVALGRGISPAADQYSLAAIAYEWLSGRRLSGLDTLYLPTTSPDGAAAIAAVFTRALAVDSAQRYPSTTAFVEALADVADQVTPRGKTTRRKAAVVAPLLEFEREDEAPALTFGAPEPEPDDVVPAALDQELAHDPAGEMMPHDDDDAVAHAEIGYVSTGGVDRPLVTGPSDLGHHDDLLGRASDQDEVAHHEPPFSDLGPHDQRPDSEPMAEAFEAAEAPDAAGGGVPLWAIWAAVLVGGVLLVVVGGRALLRWGTPAGPGVMAAKALPAPGSTVGAAAKVAATPAATSAAAASAAGTPTSTTPAPAATAPVSSPANGREPSELPQPPREPVGDAVARAATAASSPAAVPAKAAAVPPIATTPVQAAAPARPAAAPPARPVVAPPAGRAAPPAKTASAPARPASRPARPATPAAPSPRPPAAAPGRLLVRSSPSGAEVFVNGERRGVSPVTIRDLALGAYNVDVVRPGYAAAQQRVVLEAARPARALEVTLVRAGAAASSGAAPAATAPAASAATTGSLLIESRPSGARASVDGIDVGRTPVTLPSVAVGMRAVRVELPGYLIISTTTRVEPGARARMAVTLTAERPR